jgi:GTP-binding protein
MQFIDEAKIFVKSGSGGDGCVSFRREAHVARGGPDGGDGGRGGSVIFEAVEGLNTLIDFRYSQHFKARKGDHGQGRQRTGAAADDLIIKIPIGTQIIMDDGETILADITHPKQRFVAARGGQGGLGNQNFKSSINQAPRRFVPGEEAQEMWVWLKLKLLSDAGLVGLPNAGKSTFLSSVSRARPKIADYPFTTLKPQLGVVGIDEKEFVMADIPGLIEGAHEGQGLGDRFLKHVERCGVLLHLVDGAQENVVEHYKTIRHELESYSPKLAEKHEVIAINKSDALIEEIIEEQVEALEKASGKKVFVISAASGDGVKDVLRALIETIQAFRRTDEENEAILRA